MANDIVSKVTTPVNLEDSEYLRADELKPGDQILRHGKWSTVLSVIRRSKTSVSVTVEDRRTAIPYHADQQITTKVAPAPDYAAMSVDELQAALSAIPMWPKYGTPDYYRRTWLSSLISIRREQAALDVNFREIASRFEKLS